MTSIEWLENRIKVLIPEDIGSQLMFKSNIAKAKEMHKQEILLSYHEGSEDLKYNPQEYYNKTFVSKGSDTLKDYHIVDTNEMVELLQQELSDESWEGCDGCTEQDEIMYKNGYVKGYNAAISELPKEISDEEIEKEAKEFFPMNDSDVEMTKKAIWKLGAKWYREQLKSKSSV